MSTALRPVLRTSQRTTLPLSSATPSSSSLSATSYVCQSCRGAHLIRRPKRPYTFTQLVTLSDGSAFTMRTTSPHPVYRSTRDTRNAPLWNPSSKELTSVEDDEAGRLASFRARYGRLFDASKADDDMVEEAPPAGDALQEIGSEKLEAAVAADASFQPMGAKKKTQAMQSDEIDDGWDFGDDDASMLDLISSYGQEDIKQKDALPVKKGKKK